MEPFEIDSAILGAISSIIGATNCFLSKHELEHLLTTASIAVGGDGSKRTGDKYYFGLRKHQWLFNCLCNEWNTHHDCSRIIRFIETVFDPVRYTDKQPAYKELVRQINKPLMMRGWGIDDQGKLVPIQQAENLAEVDRRTNDFQAELGKRCVHQLAALYCKTELLQQDYGQAVLEAVKGLAERIREETGLDLDGSTLVEKAFSCKSPWLIFSDLQTQSGRNEQNGVSELLCALFHLVRNPLSHRPKIEWNLQRNEALDLFVLISFAHKCLDNCILNPCNKLQPKENVNR